ncbi:MAG: hypothetical protein HYT87_14465 [Nitrospirae bacterium]|nr:hypothetical protein [Nitrospirota bacterium]
MNPNDVTVRSAEGGGLLSGWGMDLVPSGGESESVLDALGEEAFQVEAGQKVLVLGCGNEPAIFRFPSGVELCWVDLLRPHLFLARAQLRDAGVILAQPTDLPFKSVFDVVIVPPSCVARFNVTESIRLMRGAQGVLKEGGRLIIEFPSRELLAASPPKLQAQRFGDVIVLEEKRLEASSTRVLIKKTYIERMGASHRVECEIHAHTAKFMAQLLQKMGLDVVEQEKGVLDPTLPCQRLVARKRQTQQKGGDFSQKMAAALAS